MFRRVALRMAKGRGHAAASGEAGGFDPFKVLGLKEGATAEEIKARHRKLALKYHPDSPGGSAERFKQVQEAYEAIKDGTWNARKEEEFAAQREKEGRGRTMYYYEAPGSTDENYIKDKSTEQKIKAFAAACFLYLIFHSLYLAVAAQKRREERQQQQQAATASAPSGFGASRGTTSAPAFVDSSGARVEDNSGFATRNSGFVANGSGESSSSPVFDFTTPSASAENGGAPATARSVEIR